jgi:hypothetical protein
VVSDQEVLSEKEIQLAGREHAVLAAVIHGVDHHKQIGQEQLLLLGRILLDFRGRAHGHAVLDRQGMEMEDVLQHHLGLLGRRLLQVHPQKQIGVRQQGGHQECLDVLAVQTPLCRKGK